MWGEFYEDVKDEEFANRDEYEMWVDAWVEDTINEASRIGRFALGLNDKQVEDELDVKIGDKDE